LKTIAHASDSLFQNLDHNKKNNNNNNNNETKYKKSKDVFVAIYTSIPPLKEKQNYSLHNIAASALARVVRELTFNGHNPLQPPQKNSLKKY